MDAKLIILVVGVHGEDFRKKPRLDNVQQRWGRWVCQLSRFDICKTMFRGHCSGDMESGRFGGFAAIRCAVIVAVYVLSGGVGEVVSLTE